MGSQYQYIDLNGVIFSDLVIPVGEDGALRLSSSLLVISTQTPILKQLPLSTFMFFHSLVISQNHVHARTKGDVGICRKGGVEDTI